MKLQVSPQTANGSDTLKNSAATPDYEKWATDALNCTPPAWALTADLVMVFLFLITAFYMNKFLLQRNAVLRKREEAELSSPLPVTRIQVTVSNATTPSHRSALKRQKKKAAASAHYTSSSPHTAQPDDPSTPTSGISVPLTITGGSSSRAMKSSSLRNNGSLVGAPYGTLNAGAGSSRRTSELPGRRSSARSLSTRSRNTNRPSPAARGDESGSTHSGGTLPRTESTDSNDESPQGGSRDDDVVSNSSFSSNSSRGGGLEYLRFQEEVDATRLFSDPIAWFYFLLLLSCLVNSVITMHTAFRCYHLPAQSEAAGLMLTIFPVILYYFVVGMLLITFLGLSDAAMNRSTSKLKKRAALILGPIIIVIPGSLILGVYLPGQEGSKYPISLVADCCLAVLYAVAFVIGGWITCRQLEKLGGIQNLNRLRLVTVLVPLLLVLRGILVAPWGLQNQHFQEEHHLENLGVAGILWVWDLIIIFPQWISVIVLKAKRAQEEDAVHSNRVNDALVDRSPSPTRH